MVRERSRVRFSPSAPVLLMKIIDLTQQIYAGMPVFPGDPEVEINQIQTFERDGWNMKQISLTLHVGTHVNVPFHGTKDGKNLDFYKVGDFIGESVRYESDKDIVKGKGVIFVEHNVDKRIAEVIKQRRPKFIGLSKNLPDEEFDIDIEKELLEEGIISFENLANCQELPKNFVFYGVPLSIKEADGGPVRAFAVV